MKNRKLAALAAMLCLSAATAAMAQPWGNGRGPGGPGRGGWDNLGTVTIDGRMGRGPDRPGPGGMDREMRNFDLGGPVERLQLRAERSDVDCRSIRATFGNGRSNEIYRGRLNQGRPVNIDMPGQARDLRGLSFTCRSLDRRDAVIQISADVGRYRQDWMRGPNWRGTWARMFNWGSEQVNNWRLISTERFEGRGETESVFAGWRGVNAESVALMPLDADARCARVVARFGNGREQTLNVNNGDYLRRGMYYRLDLPGRSRDLTALTLRCSAVNAGRVSIQIFSGT